MIINSIFSIAISSYRDHRKIESTKFFPNFLKYGRRISGVTYKIILSA